MAISIDVNPGRPGEVLGALGLFDLAAKIWPSAKAYFDENQFHITEGDKESLYSAIAGASIEAEDDGGENQRFRLSAPFDLSVNWWEQGFGRKFKLWSASVKLMKGENKRMLKIHKEIKRVNVAHAFDFSLVADLGSAPLFLDSRCGDRARTNDLGFSADKIKKTEKNCEIKTYLWTEFLCIIGLQRFRLAVHSCENKEFYLSEYTIWRRPLSIDVAPSVANGTLPMRNTQTYKFNIRARNRGYRAIQSAHINPNRSTTNV